MAASPSIPPSRSFSSKKKTSGKGTQWRLVVRRAGIALAIALVLLVVAFALLPVWISNEQGRAYVLRQLNKRLARAGGGAGGVGGMRLAVDDWSLGWFRPTSVKNLRMTLADGSPLVECPAIHSGLTLWDMVWGNYDLRSTSADALHLEIVKYADGGNSLEPFMTACGDLLGSMRGGLQINGGTMAVTSGRSKETMRYSNLKATLTIASPDAPFHLQLSAMGSSESGIAEGQKGGLAGELSVDATLPALRTLGRWNQASGRERWGVVCSLLGDIDFSAGNMPTGVVCDCLGLDAGWEASLGPHLEMVKFSNHAASPADTSRPTLLVRGSGLGDGSQSVIDGRWLLQASDDRGNGGLLEIPAADVSVANKDERFQLEAALWLSPNVATMLQHINPLLGEAQPIAPGGLVRLNVTSLALPFDTGSTAADMQATARITFPPVRFSVDNGTGSLAGQLLGATDAPGSGQQKTSRDATVGMLHATLADGAFSYENFIVTVGRSRINFSGDVGLDGQVDLLAVLPGGGGASGLSSESTQLVIDGTIAVPIVHRAQ